ncbi:HEAT repeat domain-containing protein [Leptolyngbya sp. CCNP1308]|uniref:HEAT repeat domain-containing protein n=1 Tax=Leptolyngbya sp. CCNP1308 TaxID=3110255 RepID=UPI002B217DDD|nr:HEAT repeat domain-containing protein [Leptolyngbya sp. CCNP1308]MEA5451301.1 HEAT repeat domain-containing protein [Leptolyngbya sp. CCNP1308]
MTGLPGLESAIAPGTTAPAAAQTAAPDPNPVLLKPGAEGDEVMMLQRQMRLLGLYQGPLDGRYVGPTQAAIAAFQGSAGLPANGILDQTTWQRMSTPQLVTENAPPTAEAPVLFPTAAVPEIPDVATAGTPSPAAAPTPAPVVETAAPAESSNADAEPAASATSPEPENLESAESSEAEVPDAVEDTSPGRHWGWWVLSSLALVGCLGGWRFLGRGRSRSAKQWEPASEPLSVPESQVHHLASADSPSDFPAPNSPAATTTKSSAYPDSLQPPPTPDTADLPLEATTRLSSGDIVDSLVYELASRDGAVRRHAIWELGQRGHSDAIQPLINGLLEADSQEKSLILAALSEISSRSLKPMHRALALGLQDPSPEVRKNAIRDLSRVYDTVVQLSHMLAHATQDPDPSVQETAQWALSQLNRIPAAAYPALPPDANSPYDSDSHRLPPS